MNNPTSNPKIIEHDGHAIIHGDAIAALEQLVPDNSVDLIFADPPYNIGKNFNGRMDRWPSDEAYMDWCKRWIDLCLAKLKDNGSFYLMTSTQNMPLFDLYVRSKAHILSRIIWSYDSSGVQAKRYYGSLYEPILFGVKNKDNYTFNADAILVEARTGAKRKLIDYRKPVPTQYNTQKVPGNVWNFPRVRYRMDEYEEHPTQKPTTLLERVILASSNPGDIVLDPFSGTFTTSFMAKTLGRKSIGIEIDEEYMKIGMRRLGIRDEYNGEKLRRKPKIYEQPKESPQHLVLFES